MSSMPIIDPRRRKPATAAEWLELVNELGEKLRLDLAKLPGFTNDRFMWQFNFIVLFARAAGAMDYVNGIRMVSADGVDQISEDDRKRWRQQILEGYSDIWYKATEGAL